MTKTLVYLCYGKPRYRQETMFAILSARHWLAGDEGIEIIVYTDQPSDFAWLNIETRLLTLDLLKLWMGNGAYPFRRKVACLLELLRERGGKIVFADGDTYFQANPALLFDRIGPGRSCLHMREVRLTPRKGTAGAILGQLFTTGAVRDLAGKPVALYKGEGMWNSGVIGIDGHDQQVLDEALHLMDEIWQREQRVHTVEQFALGHVMAAGELSEADDVVFHYWQDVLRVPFLEGLPALLEKAQSMPIGEAARWSYASRPRSSIGSRLIGRIKTVIHRLGMDQRWTRVSA